MNRRELLKSMVAAPIAAVLPVVAAGEPIAACVFGVDLASTADVTHVTVANLGTDGMWRILSSGELVPGNDIDAYMDEMIAAAKAA